MPFWRHTYNYHILLEVVNFVDTTQPVVELSAFAPWGAQKLYDFGDIISN